jgi:hypothetical protein
MIDLVARQGCEDAEAFDKYCTKVESTAEWGGHLELQAMAHALQRCIHVHAVSFFLLLPTLQPPLSFDATRCRVVRVTRDTVRGCVRWGCRM